jgi:hypothetical protein
MALAPIEEGLNMLSAFMSVCRAVLILTYLRQTVPLPHRAAARILTILVSKDKNVVLLTGFKPVLS